MIIFNDKESQMTTTYRATGSLTLPVSDLTAARAYLRQEDDMAQYIYPDSLQPAVHTVEWDLTDAGSWVVTLVAHRELTPVESKMLSNWISGQNSDGLGEGFEQQPFAEHCTYNSWGDPNDDFEMSSFDWETNECPLVVVK